MNVEERHYRDLLEAAPDGVLEVDREGRIALVNSATERLSGYRREELLGQPIELLVPPELRARHEVQRHAYWSNPMTRPMGNGLDLILLRKDGDRLPVEISLVAVHSGREKRVAAIVRDVTERKLAEQRIRDVQEQLMNALTSKNAELERQNREIERTARLKTEFVASISHELRTPLHTIIGFSELLIEEKAGALNDKQKRFVSHIHADSMHLLELINDILDLSKIEAGRLELRPAAFSLAGAMEEAAATIRPQAAAKGLALEVVPEPDAMLFADRVRFKEILVNLLSNAVKFTPAGGRIWIDSRLQEGFAEIAVHDTGIGIAPEHHEAIFDKFQQISATTRGVKEGTGLGLAIAKQLVEMQGGRISVESDPGCGSCFRFTVPTEQTA